MSLQTQLQNGADALALAGAAELDRTPTAIERANRAIGFRCEANRSTCQPIAGGHGLVTNSSLFGSGPDRNVRVAADQFPALVADARQRPDLAGKCDERSDAGCVRRGHGEADRAANDSAGVVFRWLELSLTVGAQAVAGFDQVVCDFTPIFICNPFETPGMTYQAGDRGPGQCQP